MASSFACAVPSSVAGAEPWARVTTALSNAVAVLAREIPPNAPVGRFHLEVQLKAAFWVGRIFAVPNHSKSSVRGADTKTQNVRAGLLNSGGVLHPCEHGLDFTHRTRGQSGGA